MAYKVAIVGSGPAGLSAAARAALRGMSHVVLERTDHLNDTVFRYQRGKHVMETPAQVPLRSDLAFIAGPRESLLRVWGAEAEALKVNVRLRAEVRRVTGARGAFRLTLAGGEEVEAAAVVLAIGTQGDPNRLPGLEAAEAHVQYDLADPAAFVGEHLVVVGGGDSAIENALGLADPALGNTVTLLYRGADFLRAKPANVRLLDAARTRGALDVLTGATPTGLSDGMLAVSTREGEVALPCGRIVARLGSTPPRRFLEACGVGFASDDPQAFPVLSPAFESTTPGLYVVGALAGYPLIKHCLNQGYDVIERLAGDDGLKPADEAMLLARLPGVLGADVDAKLQALRAAVDIFAEVTTLQMREFMLDAQVRRYAPDAPIFARNAAGDSVFAVVEGSVVVRLDPADRTRIAEIPAGQIFGELGLVSGRRRGASIDAGPQGALALEIPRAAALKLMAVAPPVKRAIERISLERLLKQIFGPSLPTARLDAILGAARLRRLKPGETLIEEGETGYDISVVRSGSLVVEKAIGGGKAFLSYLPAGAYVGEMSLFDGGRRNATVRATVATEVAVLPGELFRDLLDAEPAVARRVRDGVARRLEINRFVEAQKASFGSVVDMYTSVADFLLGQGLGEATDALLIDETLCIGCDNCETACAEAHDGVSRLDREAGRTYARLHVPTSCRHCEDPHCMTDCPPNAITRGPDGEVSIDDSCIGCGACQKNCPYGVIQMASPPPKKPGLLTWLALGLGPGPGEPPPSWTARRRRGEAPPVKRAVKCDMCTGVAGGAACVRACPTGAAMRVSPEAYLRVAHTGAPP